MRRKHGCRHTTTLLLLCCCQFTPIRRRHIRRDHHPHTGILNNSCRRRAIPTPTPITRGNRGSNSPLPNPYKRRQWYQWCRAKPCINVDTALVVCCFGNGPNVVGNTTRTGNIGREVANVLLALWWLLVWWSLVGGSGVRYCGGGGGGDGISDWLWCCCGDCGGGGGLSDGIHV